MNRLLSYKLFESITKLYEPISATTFNSKLEVGELGKAEDFTQAELFDMRDYFENLDYCWEFESLKPNLVRAIVKQMAYSQKRPGVEKMINHPFVRVIKFSDDWYYVSISDQQFKCDTFEGVIQLFKDWNKGQVA